MVPFEFWRGPLAFGGTSPGTSRLMASTEDVIMNDQTNHLDQADEEILTTPVSDDALEAAAGTDKGGAWSSAGNICPDTFPHCC
jgi:hypothetical protein